MSNKHFLCCSVFSFFLLNTTMLFAQQDKVILTKEFDSLFGKENLGINNGAFHQNPFRVINDKDRYFKNQEFIGSVRYDGKDYYGYLFKYELYQDVLVYFPNQSSGGLGIELIKDKVDFFEIENRHFVNVNKLNTGLEAKDVSGYFEKIALQPNFVLYIKYIKKLRERSDRDVVYHEFKDEFKYFLFHNNQYVTFSSRNDLISIFPEFEKEIKSFYKSNETLNKNNEILFHEKLLRELSNLLDKKEF